LVRGGRYAGDQQGQDQHEADGDCFSIHGALPYSLSRTRNARSQSKGLMPLRYAPMDTRLVPNL
jgi:hypothetical protein